MTLLKMFNRNVFLCVILNASVCSAADQDHNLWFGVLQRGLMFYQEGDYTNAFSLIEAAVMENAPNQEVHRSLALMRKAFLRMHSIQEPIDVWPASAVCKFEKLGSFSEQTDSQLAVLAAIKYRRPQNNGLVNLNTLPILDQLIAWKQQSQWKDLAYWEKARILAGSAWVQTIAWGVIEYGDTDHRKIGCLDDSPSLSIPARAAERFLMQNPKTYMGRQMRHDLYLYRTTVARQILVKLVEDQRILGESSDGLLPLKETQIAILGEAQSKLDVLSKSFPEDALSLLTAEAKLDDFLWNALESKRVIPEYLKLLRDVRGNGALVPQVANWLKELPDSPIIKHEVYSPNE